VTRFSNFAPVISFEMVKLGTSNFVCRLIHRSNNVCMISPSKGMCSGSRDLFNFWEISDNISETVQDKDIVVVEDYRK